VGIQETFVSPQCALIVLQLLVNSSDKKTIYVSKFISEIRNDEGLVCLWQFYSRSAENSPKAYTSDVAHDDSLDQFMSENQ
jgi:hypothetical protein